MQLRHNLVILLFCLFARVADAAECYSCGHVFAFGEPFYHRKDEIGGRDRQLCVPCSSLPGCFICGLPAKKKNKTFADGRILCVRDSAGAIVDEAQALEVFTETRNEVNRLFNRFLILSETNITVRLVDAPTLQNAMKQVGNSRYCASIFGITETETAALSKGSKASANGETRYFGHDIKLLDGLQKPRLMAVAAHELMHAWVSENVRYQRKVPLSPDTEEGFCELIAYHLMDNQRFDTEMRIIKANNYTKGQIDLFLRAEDEFGFNTIVEWVRSGTTPRIDADNLHWVRLTESRPIQPAVDASSLLAIRVPPTPVPDTLVLKGISGSGHRHFIMVNDATLAVNETAKVRVGQSNVVVRCIQIGNSSAVIEVDGKQQEISLTGKK